MFNKTVYRLVPESQTLPALKARCAAFSAMDQETGLAALVQAYDSPELAAFCCPLLWATKASNAACSNLVRETILLPLGGVASGDVVGLERSWVDSDDERHWDRLRKHALVYGSFFLWTPSAHVPDQNMVLLNMNHKAFASVVVQSRRLHDLETAVDAPAPAHVAEQAENLASSCS